MTDGRRGWLMVFATLTASITYGAALNPPGGVWQADDATNGYLAGLPVLLDKSRGRYMAFYYLNATSFLCSVCILVLLALNRRMLQMIKGNLVSNLLVTLNMAAMAGAFIAGSSSTLTILIADVVVAGIVFFIFMAIMCAWAVSWARYILDNTNPGDNNLCDGGIEELTMD